MRSLIPILFISSAITHADEPGKLAQLRTSYKSAVERVTEPLKKTYQKELQKLKVEFTRAGKLEEALAVDNELKELSGASPSPPQPQPPPPAGLQGGDNPLPAFELMLLPEGQVTFDPTSGLTAEELSESLFAPSSLAHIDRVFDALAKNPAFKLANGQRIWIGLKLLVSGTDIKVTGRDGKTLTNSDDILSRFAPALLEEASIAKRNGQAYVPRGLQLAISQVGNHPELCAQPDNFRTQIVRGYVKIVPRK